jgi:hypothetical protein
MEGKVALSLAIRGGRAFTCYTADEVSRAKRRQLCFQQPCATKRATTSTILLLHHWNKYTLATPQTTICPASFTYIQQAKTASAQATPTRRLPPSKLPRRARDQIEQRHSCARITRSNHGTQQREGRQSGLHRQHPIRSVHLGRAYLRQQLTKQQQA